MLIFLLLANELTIPLAFKMMEISSKNKNDGNFGLWVGNNKMSLLILIFFYKDYNFKFFLSF